MRERLFDRHNLLFRYLQDRPSIIMGRKGSGKTAYLNSVYFYGKYDHIVELGTSSALQKVVEAVQSCTEGIAFAETVAELWGQFLWLGVLVGLREKITECRGWGGRLKRYLTELHIADSQSFDEALRDMLRFFQARAGELDMSTKSSRMIERPGTALNNPVRLSTNAGLVEDWLRAQGAASCDAHGLPGRFPTGHGLRFPCVSRDCSNASANSTTPMPLSTFVSACHQSFTTAFWAFRPIPTRTSAAISFCIGRPQN